MKLINQLWSFFASVQLAILILVTISITSIIGTVIPQGEPFTFYVSRFGAKTAVLIQILDISNMYSSWWFFGLLALLGINLIVCSLDRFPAVWRIIGTDNLAIPLERVKKMSSVRKWTISAEKINNIDWKAFLSNSGWHFEERWFGESALFFSQKGRFSRVGVYIVHASILVIFSGAIVGHFLGFKGSVMIPELSSTEKIFTSPSSMPIDLGFSVRNDSFAIAFYPNGMPQEYKSSLTIIENGQEILHKDIKVNSPLTYKGITFYQSSYQGHQEFLLWITETSSQESQLFSLPFQQPSSWDNKNLRFGIINAETAGQQVNRAKIWFKAGSDPAITEWIANNDDVSIASGGKNYTLKVKQLYSTGLQVAKDPGVWLVYTGCGLLLLGLYMAFFTSHKRIWLYQHVSPTEQLVYLAGSASKNKQGFRKTFAKLEALIDQNVGHQESKNH